MTIPLVDSHVHFWDLTHPRLSYGWLAPQAVHPILGNIDGIKSTRYEAEHLHAETRFANVVGFVHVQAAVGTDDPVEETRWLEDMAARGGVPLAIVAHADLSSPRIEETLDAHLAASSRVSGVRDFATEGALASGDVMTQLERGISHLASRDLVLDLDCEFPQMAAARDLARRHPDVTFALEHIGYPRARTDEYFRGWRAGITALAEADNVVCKVSGLGMCDPGWTDESIRPWVLHCVEQFTPDRIVFGTNWPVDRLYSSYDAIVAAYRRCISEFTAQEQAAMFHRNARELYRL